MPTSDPSLTPNLALPYLAAGQAQKHVTLNESLRRLDALVHLVFEDRDLAEPPAVPAEGQRYLVASGASGAWSGRSGTIAAFQDGGWLFYPPETGWIAWIRDEDALAVWNGAEWQDAGTGGSPETLGIHATADTTNRLAVASEAVLFSHDGADSRVKINRAGGTDTASLVFQSAYSGRAEIGLAGDDRFRLKVSADGTSWANALEVDPATGEVSFPNSSLGGGGGSGITPETQAALDLKAPLASPALTGTPTAPTATGGTSSTQLATTAFVQAAIAGLGGGGGLPVEGTLTDAATIVWDMAAAANATLAIGGNRTLGNPTGAGVGARGRLRVTQDATGGRTLAFGENWVFAGGTAPALSTAANAEDVLYYDVLAADRVLIVDAKKAVSGSTAPPAVTTFRYLRLRVGDVFNPTYAGFWEVDFSADGGTTLLPAAAMAGGAAPSPLVATHSTSAGASFDAWVLFDNNPGTRWTTAAGSSLNQWVTLDLGAGNALAPNWLRYSIVNVAGFDMSPKSIAVLGSNTGAFAGEEATLFSISGLTAQANGTVVTHLW